MAQGFQTCRFCKQVMFDHDPSLKYGTRHYAHHECYLKAGKTLGRLRRWQIEGFPYFLLQRYGLLDRARALTGRYI